MHKLQMTALAGVLALSTSGSDSSKTPFQPDLTAFFPKKPAQPTIQKPEYPTGLIQSTNVEQRLKQIQLGQSDPFTRLFPPQLETATKPEKVFPDLPTLPVPKPVPTKKATVKITRPSTKLAEGVEILGVMQIGSEPRAIVKVPTDGISRYVSEGQQLSDGQLLVKKIEISPNSEPRVILEQNGIEISKAVGDSLDATDPIASSTLSQIGSDYKTTNEELGDENEELGNEAYTNEQAAQSVASSTLSQISSDYKARNESDKAPSDDRAAEPQQVIQQEEYTATIPVPSPPLSSFTSQKKSPGLVASSPPANFASSPRANSTAPTDTASVRKDYSNSELLSLNSQSEVKRVSTSDGLGRNSVANRHYRSSFDVSEKQQQLIDKLRSGSKPEIEDRLESDSPSTLQAPLGNQTYQQQSISDRLGYKKPGATSNEVVDKSSNIEVLAHRQRLINELRRTTRHTNN